MRYSGRMDGRVFLAVCFSVNLISALTACEGKEGEPATSTMNGASTEEMSTGGAGGMGGTSTSGDEKPTETGGSSGEMTTGEMTSGLLTTGDPTTGEPTETTTNATGGDPEIKMDCEAGQMWELQQKTWECGCGVESGTVPDIEYCLAGLFDPVVLACECEVRAKYAENAAVEKCRAEADAELAVCTSQLACLDTTQNDCYNTHSGAIQSCGPYTKQTYANVAIQCWGSPAFECMSGETIPTLWKCDYLIDCNDASDEGDCKFYCFDGQTIPRELECDGSEDCNDGSDEYDCR